MAEAVQTELMSDNRVAIQHGQLWRTAASEVKWIIDLKESTWEAIAVASGMELVDLRDRAIRASHISFHFIWRRILEPYADLPWSLARGDVGANFQRLVDDDRPDEPFCQKIWDLHHRSPPYPREQLLEAIRLLGEAGWTSMVCEQQHGSLAQLRRRHPEYSMDSLISRGLMHQTTRILQSSSADERKVALLTKKILKLENKVPTRAGPTNMIVKALMSVARSKQDTKCSVFC